MSPAQWGCLEGLIPVLGGIYGILMAKGIVPRTPRDPEKQMQWRRKFGPLLMILCPITILYGLVQLSGMFR